MDELMMGTIYLEGINSLLALALVYLYAQNYKALKTTAGLGLLIFSLVLLLENVVGLYFHLTTGEFYAKMVINHVFFLKLIEGVALGVLVYTGWKE